MSFMEELSSRKRPDSIRSIPLPREPYHPSPDDWRNEVLYFLLPDRFSNGNESSFLPLDRSDIPSSRPAGFRWDKWAESGGERWQGGTIKGIESKLGYLAGLGITAIWIGPLFKQRRHLDTYHGYAIQDFLEIDPHFGTRKDLVELVAAAHKEGVRVILDIIFNHSGHNWDYAGDQVDPPYKPFPGFYQKGKWLNGDGDRVDSISREDDGVWPAELQPDICYTRAGKGSLADENIEDDHAQIKRTDFDGSFRDFNFDGSDTLNDLTRCFKYWIALTDCDGFRLDTLKHVPMEVARNFCGSIKEYAANIGKTNFFLMGEVAGPDENAGKYLDVLQLNLSATLDIGEMRPTLSAVAKGLLDPESYFKLVKTWHPLLGSHRFSGTRHILILDDHDHVQGAKIRFSNGASPGHQVIAGIAIQLFSLGIPCIYYGTEQALSGPEEHEWKQYLPDFSKADKFLREIMFAAEHPRAKGKDGLPDGNGTLDSALPAFGAFGTVGRHCFDEKHPVYRRIRHLIDVRKRYPVLRYGRLYQREISNFGNPFAFPRAGELIVWSRILDEEEVLVVINGNGKERRGGDVNVDLNLNKAGSRFEVVANTAQAAAGPAYSDVFAIGQKLEVKVRDQHAFVEIRDLPSSEVIVISSRP